MPDNLTDSLFGDLGWMPECFKAAYRWTAHGAAACPNIEFTAILGQYTLTQNQDQQGNRTLTIHCWRSPTEPGSNPPRTSDGITSV